jgi:acetone carboxylase gamma subunit
LRYSNTIATDTIERHKHIYPSIAASPSTLLIDSETIVTDTIERHEHIYPSIAASQSTLLIDSETIVTDTIERHKHIYPSVAASTASLTIQHPTTTKLFASLVLKTTNDPSSSSPAVPSFLHTSYIIQDDKVCTHR